MFQQYSSKQRKRAMSHRMQQQLEDNTQTHRHTHTLSLSHLHMPDVTLPPVLAVSIITGLGTNHSGATIILKDSQCVCG